MLVKVTNTKKEENRTVKTKQEKKKNPKKVKNRHPDKFVHFLPHFIS